MIAEAITVCDRAPWRHRVRLSPVSSDPAYR